VNTSALIENEVPPSIEKPAQGPIETQTTKNYEVGDTTQESNKKEAIS
jgi:hypothetical protein